MGEGALNRIDEDEDEYESEIKTDSTFYVLEAKQKQLEEMENFK